MLTDQKSSIKKETIQLETKRLILRPLKSSDVTEGYIAGLNDAEVNHYLLNVKQHVQTRGSVEAFVESHWTSSKNYLFGLFLKEKSSLVGTLRVGDISEYHQNASLGICLFLKTYWGQGLGQEALEKVVSFCFQELGLHYLEAGCYEENQASVSLFQKSGFEVKAVFPEKYRYQNNFMKVVFFGRVNPHFDTAQFKNARSQL